MRKALAASSKTSLEPFPIIILLTSNDSCSAINSLSFFESPSGYKCKSFALFDKASIALGDGPKGFSLLASLTTLSGLYSATTASIDLPGS